MFSSNVSQKPVQKLLDESEIRKISSSSRNNKNNKVNPIEETGSSSDHRKYNTELLNIRIIQNGKIISVHHLPEEVIVRSKARMVEVYDNDDGILSKTYHLVRRNSSWLENTHADSSEILLDLHVKGLEL